LKTKKWTVFTYTGKETKFITKLFKNTSIKPAFKTTNTLKKHLFPKRNIIDKYEYPGIYTLKCMDCPRQYIGQTGRNFKTRYYKEHTRDIHNNKSTSRYVQHIPKTRHASGNINDTMEIVKVKQKGLYLNTLENFYIYKLFWQGIQLNNNCPSLNNPIFRQIQNISR
jgi:hypothetical protein